MKVSGNIVEISLTKGYQTVIDRTDWPRVEPYTWHVINSHTKRPYAGAYGVTRTSCKLLMHRLLVDAPTGFCVDHINRDTLDNRRANLRICTTAQNIVNQPLRSGTSSRFRGVSWKRDMAKWRAYIKREWRFIHLGYFTSEVDAARAVDAALLKAWGEYATLNFPRSAHGA